MRPKIFLVISDPLLTDTLHVAFQSNGLDVVEAVSQAHKLDLLLLNIQPDVLVVEQTLLLNLSELEKTIDLKVIKAVCLLSDLNFYFISEWQEKGIDGFAHRINGFEELRNCISSVIVGKNYLPQNLSGSNDKKLFNNHIYNNEKISYVSARELQVAEMVEKGCSDFEIANKLGISQRTVQRHKYNICKKYGLSGKNGLLRFLLTNTPFEKNKKEQSCKNNDMIIKNIKQIR